MRKLVWLFIGSLAACGPSSGDYVDADIGGGGDGGGTAIDGGGGGGGNEFADAAPPEPCEKMDILFVVDNSGSMSDEQASLTANFPLFVSVLDNYQVEGGGFLDYRIAVTTTGVDASPTFDPLPGTIPPLYMPQTGDNGEFRQDCGMTRPWLERTDADVTGQFECIAAVGTGGPDVEMQLYATKLALSHPAQLDFVREDALLAFVILSDEDDCSVEDNQAFTVPNDSCKPRPAEMEPIDSYLSFFDTLKSGRGRWAAAVIAGDTSCPESFNDGERLREFKASAGDNVIHSPICVSDLSAALEQAIEKFEAACEALPPIL